MYRHSVHEGLRRGVLVGLCSAGQAVQTQQTLQNVAVSAAVGKAVILAGLNQFSKHTLLLLVQTGFTAFGLLAMAFCIFPA